jgi:hypothetical protein
MPKKRYEDGAFYWARKTWGEDLEPFIVQCEDPYGRGKFRQFSGQWGSDDAYEILSEPLVYDGKVKLAWTLSEIPKNDGRWCPAGWWCATEQYGRSRVPEEIKDGLFYVMELPQYKIKVVCDDLGDHYTYLPNDMFDWCVTSLKGWWSPVDSARGKCYVVFSDQSDSMLFKLKWL